MEFHEILGMQTYTYGTWNVQGLTEKKKETFSEIERENEDLVVLTETKLRGSGQEEHGKYVHLYSGVKTGRARAGVSIVLKKGHGNVTRWEAVSERIITARLNIRGQKITIIGVYWVDESATPYIKDRFQDNFRNVLKKVKKEHELIIFGDFNSKIGTSSTSKVVGKFGDGEINSNGRRLIEVCEEFGLKIQNTFFDHTDIHKYTWYHKRNPSKSLIDYCITRQVTTLHFHDVLACRWLECGTDHVFLEATISFPLIINTESRESVVQEDIIEMRKYKTYLLYSKSIRDSYKDYLDSLISLSNERSTQEMYNHLKESIHLAAFHVLGIQERDVFGELLWDKEIMDLRAKRLSTKDENETGSLPDKITFDSHFDKIKNEVWEGICSTIDTIKRSERSKTVWCILNEVLNRSNENVIHQQPSEEFCRSLFKSNRISVKEFQVKKDEQTLKKYKIESAHSKKVSVADVTKALEELRNENWPVPGGISIQLLRSSSLKTKTLLANLVQDILNGKEIPLEISETYIVNAVKNKSTGKYTIEDELHAHCIMRIMGFLMKEILEKNDGSKNSRPIISQLTHLDTTFTLRLLLQKNAEKQNPPLHLASVDLKQTCFGIQYSKLFKILEKCGICKTLLAVLELLLTSNTIKIASTNELSEKFTLTKGVTEQSNLGPTLLKMYIQESIKKWSEENSANSITIDNRILSYITSNDKLIIVTSNHTSLETMVMSLKHCLKNLGLHISLKNVKYLGNEKLTLGRTTIQGESIMDFDGSVLELDGRNVEEVSNRIRETKNAIGYLHPVARDENVSMKNKKRIFNRIIRCVLMNGCETWTLTDDLKESLNLVEMNYWKWCCEKHSEKFTSQQLRTLMDIKNTVFDILMLRKVAWYTKVKEMSLDKWPVWLLNWSPKGNGKIGRPRRKWTDGIEEILRDFSKYENQKLVFNLGTKEKSLSLES